MSLSDSGLRTSVGKHHNLYFLAFLKKRTRRTTSQNTSDKTVRIFGKFGVRFFLIDVPFSLKILRNYSRQALKIHQNLMEFNSCLVFLYGNEKLIFSRFPRLPIGLFHPFRLAILLGCNISGQYKHVSIQTLLASSSTIIPLRL